MNSTILLSLAFGVLISGEGDGVVVERSDPELATARASHLPPRVREQLRQRWERHQGRSLHEEQGRFREPEHPSPPRFRERVRRYVGKLVRERLQERFDTNEDGLLGPRERKRVRQLIQERRGHQRSPSHEPPRQSLPHRSPV